ncbi:MAG: tetratricopeptide repeat protein [Nitrospinae bacterium]|nr:tetratricopeptide repeat protein [Nitrospinota bacterium]
MNYSEFIKNIKEAAKGTKKTFPGVKILIVDHDESASRTLFNLLRNSGFSRIDRSKSTPHSLYLIKKDSYDIFFINYRLSSPDMGMALIEHLYADGYQEKALTFLILNEKEKIPAEFPQEYNADDILLKPFNLSRIFSLLHDACFNRLLRLKTQELINENKIRDAVILNIQATGKSNGKTLGALAAAKIYEKINYIEEAIALYRVHLSSFPNCAIVLDSIGLLLKKQGRFRESEYNFVSAMKKNPYYLPAKLHLSELYYQNGEKEKARDILKLALRYNPLNIDANKEFALVSRELGDHASAETAFKTVLQDSRYAEDPDLLAAYGDTLMMNKKPAEAVESLNKSLANRKADVDVVKNSQKMKETFMAKALCFLKFEDIGKRKLASGCFKAAERSMQKTGASMETLDEFKLSAGKTYLEHGMEEEAGKAFSEYIDADPKSKARQGALIGIYKLFNKLKEALALIEKAIQRSADSIEKLDQENRRLRREGRFAEAVANYHELINRYPSDDGLHFNCGRTCLEWSRSLGENTKEGIRNKALAFTHFSAALKLDRERISLGLKAIGLEEREIAAYNYNGMHRPSNTKPQPAPISTKSQEAKVRSLAATADAF